MLSRKRSSCSVLPRVGRWGSSGAALLPVHLNPHLIRIGAIAVIMGIVVDVDEQALVIIDVDVLVGIRPHDEITLTIDPIETEIFRIFRPGAPEDKDRIDFKCDSFELEEL